MGNNMDVNIESLKITPDILSLIRRLMNLKELGELWASLLLSN